jgi:hypothetical protein
VNGVEVARGYYEDVVAPLVATRWPALPHSAGRLGSGSDVLGLDDDQSRDHDWGLRLNLMVPDELVAEVDGYLERELPASYDGLPTRFESSWDPTVRHRVQVDTPGGFTRSRLGVDAARDLSVVDWLAQTGQALLEVTTGAVFVDIPGELTAIRRRLRWYPDDLWRYVVAAAWSRLAQELPVMGRAGQRGDRLGAGLIAGRLADTAVRLGSLLEREWAPYPKWRAAGFANLPRAGVLATTLDAAVAAAGSAEREAAFVDVLTGLLDLQRTIGLPAPERAVEPFFDRPFVGVDGRIVDDLLASIADDDVRRLPRGVGAIDQWVDNVDVLMDPLRRRALTDVLIGLEQT